MFIYNLLLCDYILGTDNFLIFRLSIVLMKLTEYAPESILTQEKNLLIVIRDRRLRILRMGKTCYRDYNKGFTKKLLERLDR